MSTSTGPDPAPPVDVALRRAGPHDAPFIRDLARVAYATYVERIGREPGPMVDDYERRIAEDECWVASIADRSLVDSRVVGYLVLRLEPDHMLLDNVAVAPDQQGRAIGTFLLEFAEERARAHDREEIRLYTHEKMTENIARYTRLGYVETHREDQRGFSRVFMTKRLDATVR